MEKMPNSVWQKYNFSNWVFLQPRYKTHLPLLV